RLPNGVSRSNKPAAPPETAAAVTEYTTKDLPVRLSTGAGPNGSTQTQSAPLFETSPNKSSLPSVPTIPGTTPAKWDEENAPDWQLLDPSERDLCSKCRLQPKPYLAIKNAIFAEAMKNDGKLKKKNGYEKPISISKQPKQQAMTKADEDKCSGLIAATRDVVSP
ncbi:hypothetical protein KC331_g4575, partial [Hortaea werneckii]